MNIIYRMFLYDFLYEYADLLISKYNPCDTRVSRSGVATCVHNIDRCCNSCKHLGPRGCTVRSLSCKLYICMTARQEMLYSVKEEEGVISKLYKAKVLARKYNLIGFRASQIEVYDALKGRKGPAANAYIIRAAAKKYI